SEVDQYVPSYVSIACIIPVRSQISPQFYCAFDYELLKETLMTDHERLTRLECQVRILSLSLSVRLIAGAVAIATCALCVAAKFSEASSTEPIHSIDDVGERILAKGILPYLSELDDAPIGTVVAFCGQLPEDDAAREAWERTAGWMLCDGRDISSP